MTRALTFILSAMLAGACAGQSDDRIEYAASVNVSNPELVAIGSDVEVVANAREPIFRTNHAYWLYRGERWYRAADLRGEWIRIATPPAALAAIADPQRYANYNAPSRTTEHRDLSTRREDRMPREPSQREPLSPSPVAPYPRPPQQQPPVPFDDPGTVDRVPEDPALPGPPDRRGMPMPHEPDELGRPDPIRD